MSATSSEERCLMDKMFVRNFFIFLVILLCAVGTLGTILITGDKELDQTDHLIEQTYEVILEAEKLTSLVESILSAQRGYLLTGDESMMERYESKKGEISETLAHLSELTSTNQSQQSRLDEIRNYISNFTARLEERANIHQIKTTPQLMDGVEMVNTNKNDILRLNASILEEEYNFLNDRIRAVERKKGFYLASLIIALAVGTVLLLLFNAFLLNAQRKRSNIEESLRQSEDRFALAIEGTQDGIFDWDLKTNKVFYSRRFFEMLGYNKSAYEGSPEDSKDLIHPEDVDKVWGVAEQYLDGKLSEYSQEFRIKHSSGRWVWLYQTSSRFDSSSGRLLIKKSNPSILSTIWMPWSINPFKV